MLECRPLCRRLAAITSWLILTGMMMRTEAVEARVSAEAPAFPTIPVEHPRARELLANAMRYLADASNIVDPASGYPVEGWNREPERGLGLSSFTQLTAIGEWLEVHARVVAGSADTPWVSREQALARLIRAVDSLCQDQRDPRLSERGLLANFLDLSSGGRLGPLAGYAAKEPFLQAFGGEKGEAMWSALIAEGWLRPQRNGTRASIARGGTYGAASPGGPLARVTDEQERTRVMQLLDRRPVTVVFGDNANLTTSVGKTIGTLLLPQLKHRPGIRAVRQKLEQFLERQADGYAHLLDRGAGLFHFGWDGSIDQWLGWEDASGSWQPGYMDYLVNEFRGPTTFVILRYGLPATPLSGLGFKVKPYRAADGRDLYTLAPWDGSAFQGLGLGLAMGELRYPAWREILRSLVDIEIDFARAHKLPGFLSECYTGEGASYTGDVGIPEIAATASPRITTTASLYSLGVAYQVAPAEVEQLLADHWPAISPLLTDHGPWEGYNMASRQAVRVQTTAHTLSLILGLLGTGTEDMMRYLESKRLGSQLDRLCRSSAASDLLASSTLVVITSDSGAGLRAHRDRGALRIEAAQVREALVELTLSSPGVGLSGGVLDLHYRTRTPLELAVTLERKTEGAARHGIPTELQARLVSGDRDQSLRLPLPPTPGLEGVTRIVVRLRHEAGSAPMDLAISRLAFAPLGKPPRSPRPRPAT